MFDYKNFSGFLDPKADKSLLVDSKNRQKTKALFEEVMSYSTRLNGHIALYTMREHEYKGYPSAYQIYMSSVDEYEAAMKLVGSMKHWRKLCKLYWFKNGNPKKFFEGIETWREDMRMRDASTAKKVVLDSVAKGDTPSANRLLSLSTPKEAKRAVGAPKHPVDQSEEEEREKRINELSKEKELE